jgi:hypothetical protein
MQSIKVVAVGDNIEFYPNVYSTATRFVTLWKALKITLTTKISSSG